MDGPGCNGTIVIAETDPLMREIFERWLGEAGYSVYCWSIGSRPASVPASQGAPVLLIADVSTPRLAHARVRDLQSVWAAPILLVSGRFSRGVGECRQVANSLGVRTVLAKPFTREELLAAVEGSIKDTT